MPGGFGTFYEIFEIITLVKTKRMPPKPIVLIGKSFWQPLIYLYENPVKLGTISKQELLFLNVTDNLEEAISILESKVRE